MNEIIEAVVDQTGNIQIPEPYHKELGVTPGRKWRVTLKPDGELSLQPVVEEPEIINKNGLWVVRTEIDEDVKNNWLQIVRQNRERPLLGIEGEE